MLVSFPRSGSGNETITMQMSSAAILISVTSRVVYLCELRRCEGGHLSGDQSSRVLASK